MKLSHQAAMTASSDFYRSAFELLDEALLASKEPEALAARICEKLLYISGADGAMVMQVLDAFGGQGFHPLCIKPEQQSSMVDDAQLTSWLEAVRRQRKITDLSHPGTGMPGKTGLGLPIICADGKLIGILMLLGVPDDPHKVSQLKKSLEFLLRYLAETLNNAFAREAQEALIVQRTEDLWMEIVERKAVEEVLRKNRDEWEKTFNAMPDVVTLQAPDKTIVRANRAANVLFGLDEQQVLGKKCYELFSNLQEPCPGCPVDGTVADILVHSDVIRHERLGRTFMVNSAPLLDDQGEIELIVHIAKDISERKRLEQELLQAQKLEAVGTLAGGIAHDFNNILSAIIGYSEIIKMGLTDDNPMMSDVDEIIRAGRRAADLVKQILTFSRKENADIELFEPHLIVSEALKMLRASLPATVEITGTIRPDCGFIKANPNRLHQIMMNLCTNAVQAMPDEKGTLKVNLSRVDVPRDFIREPNVTPGPFIRLSVADTGSGIKESRLERIFDPYFTTTNSVEHGTGLGLAVVYGIVNDAKGLIRIESAPGKGSRFDVYLPAEMMPEQADQTRSETRPPTGTEHILIVDDESSVTHINRTILESLGYRTTIEQDSVRALKMFLAEPGRFDLVLTDQTMPGLSGADLAKAVLEVRPDLPIILCTGYSSVVSKEDALAMGIRKYLLKPVPSMDLATSIRNVLDNR